jgi:ubiquinone/menaquinone biosynthesis C-methylase UbiE
MNWHARYAQQANWTRDLRNYIFDKVHAEGAHRVLEVGCGTGAVLSEVPNQPNLHGLDINRAALEECRLRVPDAVLVHGNALQLPYLDQSFDIVYCHFLLLWVRDPLQALLEMKRITQQNGYVIAFAEPNYLQRIDAPEELIPLGKWQTESLIQQGADPGLGARLAELFFEAEITIVETGTLEDPGNASSPNEWEMEWNVIETDLDGWVPEPDIQRMKRLDQQARERKTRVLHVPTHFAWGQVRK